MHGIHVDLKRKAPPNQGKGLFITSLLISMPTFLTFIPGSRHITHGRQTFHCIPDVFQAEGPEIPFRGACALVPQQGLYSCHAVAHGIQLGSEKMPYGVKAKRFDAGLDT